MHEGLFDIFLDADAAVSTPTCGPCLGGHMGILAAGERAVATTNRNFVGRMGDPTSEVYLARPAVAAATAVAGHIALPGIWGRNVEAGIRERSYRGGAGRCHAAALLVQWHNRTEGRARSGAAGRSVSRGTRRLRSRWAWRIRGGSRARVRPSSGAQRIGCGSLAYSRPSGLLGRDLIVALFWVTLLTILVLQGTESAFAMDGAAELSHLSYGDLRETTR